MLPAGYVDATTVTLIYTIITLESIRTREKRASCPNRNESRIKKRRKTYRFVRIPTNWIQCNIVELYTYVWCRKNIRAWKNLYFVYRIFILYTRGGMLHNIMIMTCILRICIAVCTVYFFQFSRKGLSVRVRPCKGHNNIILISTYILLYYI